MDLKEEAILGADIERHWYYRSKAAALCRLVAGLQPKRLLDVGAGHQIFLRPARREPSRLHVPAE